MADYSDNFNRANGALGSNWTLLSGAYFNASNPAIASNYVAENSSSSPQRAAAFWSANSLASDQYAEVAYQGIPTGPLYIGPAVRLGASQGYFVKRTIYDDGKGSSGSTVALFKWNGTSESQIGTTIDVPSNEVVCKLTAQGSALKVYTATTHGGTYTLRIDTTDSAYGSGGSAGMWFAGYAAACDNFYGGDLGAAETLVALTGSASSSTYGTLPAATLSPPLSGIANTLASGLMSLSMSVATMAAPAATAGNGSVGFGAPLTGSAATSASGTIAPSATVPLTGAAATSAYGVVSPPLTISGQSMASGQGSVAPTSAPALTGDVATAAPGSIAGIGLSLTGQQANIAQGNLGYGAPTIVGIIGQQLAVGYGRVNPATFAKTSAGVVAPSVAIPLSGLSLAANPGVTASVVTGWVAQTATGSVAVQYDSPLFSQQLAASPGTATATGSRDLTGRSVTAAQGAVSATGPGMVALTGSSLATTTGSAAPSDQHELTGSSAATGSAGIAAAVNSVPIAGSAATTSVGTVGVISTGSVQLTGLGVTCSRGTVYTSGNPSDEASAAAWTETSRHLVWKRLPTTTHWRP